MAEYFYPPTVLVNDDTGTGWSLTIMANGKLGIMDEHGNVRPLVNAQNFTALERTPVLAGLMHVILELWLMFAISKPDGSLSASGFAALEEAEKALRAGRFLQENGRPKEEHRASALLGAGELED